jgi:hypothetical protein
VTDPIEDLRARRLVQDVPVDAKAIDVGRSFDRDEVLHDLAIAEQIVALADRLLDRSA